MLGDYRFVTGGVRLSRMEVFEGYQFRVLADLPHGDLESHLGFTRLQGSGFTGNRERLRGGVDPNGVAGTINQFPGQVVGLTRFQVPVFHGVNQGYQIAIGLTGGIDLLVAALVGEYRRNPGVNLFGLVLVLGIFVLSNRLEPAINFQI